MIGRRTQVGDRYGSLTVIENPYSVRINGAIIRFAVCKCDCGTVKPFRLSNIRNRHSCSCGCAAANATRARCKTHGMCRTKIYGVWNTMKSRCYNENNKAYKNYGGRGISVCSDWRNDFSKFYDFTLSHGYKEGLEIDRIDVNGNYCPENCRFISRLKNMRNQRKTIIVKFNGNTVSLRDAYDETGRIVPFKCVEKRLRLGWRVEDALLKPRRRKSFGELAQMVAEDAEVE